MLNTSRSGSLMFITTTVAIYIQGGLNKKETELNLCSMFSVSTFNEFCLFA